jgi:hypothetical protein
LKIKQEFVTNSSSTHYILIPEPKTHARLKTFLKSFKIGYPKTFHTLKQLITYTQDEKYTWVEEMTSLPHVYYRLDHYQFAIIKWFINQKTRVLLAYVDQNQHMYLHKVLMDMHLNKHYFINDSYYMYNSIRTEWTEYLEQWTPAIP